MPVDIRDLLRMAETLHKSTAFNPVLELDRAAMIYLYPEEEDFFRIAMRHEVSVPSTCRSTLKAMRPKGYRWIIEVTPKGESVVTAEREIDGEPCVKFMYKGNTEELAEFNVVFRAIHYERTGEIV